MILPLGTSDSVPVDVIVTPVPTRALLIRLPPVMLPVALTPPAVLMLPPATLPAMLAKPEVITLPAFRLPTALITPLAVRLPTLALPAVMLPAALTMPPVKILPAHTLPATVMRFDAQLNVRPAFAPILPESLNNTCVFAPVTAILPEMLPLTLPQNILAVTTPVAEILQLVFKLPVRPTPPMI